VNASSPGREMILDQSGISLMILERTKERGSFDESFSHRNLDLRSKTKTHYCLKMKIGEVWRKIRKSEIPGGFQCARNK
jgi:hypothetical protein